MEKVHHANINQKEPQMTVISDKVNLSKENYQGQRGTLCNKIKGSVYQDYVTILNVCAHLGHGRAKQESAKIHKAKTDRTERSNGQIHWIVGYSNTPVPRNDRTRQKITKDIEEFSDSINQQDLIDICRTFHPKHLHF